MDQGETAGETVPMADYQALLRELDAVRSGVAFAATPPVKALDEARLRGIANLRQSLATNLVDKTDDTRIATEVRTFRVVVAVLDDLIAVAARCAGPTCRGWTAEGASRMATAEQLAAERARADAAERAADALRTELALSRTDSFRF